MKKKGSLQLSINAIVIIILAITLLGLGLTFMRTFIGKGSEQFTGIIEGVSLENRATATEPFTIDRTLTLETGKEKEVFIGFYCNNPSQCTDAVPSIDKCIAPDGTTVSDGTDHLTMIASPTDVKAHEDIGFRILVSTDISVQPGDYICNMKVDGSTDEKDWAKQKQITISVV